MSEDDWFALILLVLVILNIVLHAIERRSLRREIARLKRHLEWLVRSNDA